MSKEVKFVNADWKDMGSLIDGFEKAIEHFGLFMYDDPRTEGSDTFGYVISKEELTNDELVESSNQYWK